MFDDLVETWQQLGNMLADVAQNFSDMHVDDVIGVLDNCTLKSAELTRGIAMRRQYVKELRPYWQVPERGGDAGMPPVGSKRVVPPVTGEGKDIS